MDWTKQTSTTIGSLNRPNSVCILVSQLEDGWMADKELSEWVIRLGRNAVLKTTSRNNVSRNDALYNRDINIYTYIYQNCLISGWWSVVISWHTSLCSTLQSSTKNPLLPSEMSGVCAWLLTFKSGWFQTYFTPILEIWSFTDQDFLRWVWITVHNRT